MPELSTSPSPTKSDSLPSGHRSSTSTISASSRINTPPVELYTLEDAHESSVLSVQFDLKEDGSGGTLVTSGSDIKACVWDVTFIKSVQGARDGDGLKSLKRGLVDGEEDEADIRVKVEKVGTLRGHMSGVLHVVLSRDRIVTW
jgi:WD40 repeat protein